MVQFGPPISLPKNFLRLPFRTQSSHESPKEAEFIFKNTDLADFRTIAKIIYVLLNQTGSLWGAWKQATRRRLLHGAKADGEGG